MHLWGSVISSSLQVCQAMATSKWILIHVFRLSLLVHSFAVLVGCLKLPSSAMHTVSHESCRARLRITACHLPTCLNNETNTQMYIQTRACNCFIVDS